MKVGGKIQYAPPKAAHGAPCNGCGQCCIAQLCPLAVQLFGDQRGPCPALEPLMFGYTCGLIAHPETYAPQTVLQHGQSTVSAAAARLLGAGAGCDAWQEGERVNHSFRQDMIQKAKETPATEAIAIWRNPK